MLTAKKRNGIAGVAGRILLLLPILLAAGSAAAQDATLTLEEGQGYVGDVITTTISTTDLTGLGVLAFEMEFHCSVSSATLLSVENSGTLTDGWGAPEYGAVGDGHYGIAMAGTTPLAGAGTLLILEWRLGPSTYDPWMGWDHCVLNEGGLDIELEAGRIIVDELPTLSISPSYGELAVGETLEVSTWGGTSPYTYSTTDPLIADFVGDEMQALSPGRVRVISEDATGIIDQSSGWFDIRALRLTGDEVSGIPGDIVTFPILVGDTTPFGVISVETNLSYDDSRLRVLNVELKDGIAEDAGWEGLEWSLQDNLVLIAMSGSAPLSGAGTLVNVVFEVLPGSHDVWLSLMPEDGLFNEIYPAAHTAGRFTIDVLPNLYVHPNSAEVTVGETRAFSVSGGGVAPYVWEVLDPAVAEINELGQLTGLAHGETRIRVTDSVGAIGLSNTIRVCGLGVSLVQLDAGDPQTWAIVPDRDLAGLGISSLEMHISYSTSYITILDVTSLGTATDVWGAPLFNDRPGDLLIVSAGMVPASGVDPLMEFTLEASGSTHSLRIDEIYLNEGDICALVVDAKDGELQDDPEPDTGKTAADRISNHPNPFNPQTTIAYSLGEGGPTRLRIYDLQGRLVRTLLSGETRSAGPHSEVWDGCADDGRPAASGTYVCRLTCGGQVIAKRMSLIR